jgi:hypothetical protein
MPEFNVRRLTGLLGIDLLSWLTVEAGAGMTEVELDGESEDRDRDVEWRVGARLRLFDYRLPSEEPIFFESNPKPSTVSPNRKTGTATLNGPNFIRPPLRHLNPPPDPFRR